MEKSKQYYLSIIIGLILVALGIFYNITNLTNNIISLFFANAGIIVIVVGTIKYNQLGAGLTQDERTQKISARAISYSWLITFVAVNIFYWTDYFKVISLNLSQVLGIIFFIMILSSGISQWILQRKGVLDED